MGPKKIVVVGGVAGGMSAAARARRLSEDAHIVVLERDAYVSFANCGMPYHIGGDIPDRDELLVQTPESLAANLNLDVRVANEVVAIDTSGKIVQVRDLGASRTYQLPYDKLVLATGAKPVQPSLPGIDSPLVHTLRNLEDMDRIKAVVDAGRGRAVVIGGGYIGIEMVEALRHREWQVTLLEAADQVMGPLDPEMAQQVQAELARNGVQLHLGTKAEGFTDTSVLTSDGVLPADLVVLAIGVLPESSLARFAGLHTTDRGAIVVDAHQVTSDPDVYAVGDSVQVTDTVTGEPTVVPLAGPANRQGRIAADHMFGRDARYTTTQGTAIVKVFDLTAGGTGANEKILRRHGIDYRKVYVHPNGHASYYPGTAAMHLKLLFAADDGRVLGGQVVGYDGVDKRIDVLAVAVRAGLTVWDLAELELAYAPPYGSAKDPINMAGFQGSNLLDGTIELWYPQDWGNLPADAVILDVRTERENLECALPMSVNIPVQELRERYEEIDQDRPVYVYCRSGFRSYLAYRMLKGLGFQQVATLSGGTLTMEHSVPWLRPLNGHREPIINYAEEDAACALEVLDEVPFANATD
ncbi:MAG: FAD-dependent oxidoreductase [Actinobacteria bacterium]|nr:FAD-dependent oxidoreductase [Actinomycetota bacterium]MCB9429949.1 FAD-dependent oxidoreductase [Actinomycetota bacterium]MCO5301378.1 FAD-dependent oxidoreductase [Candidatus Nanopelagicales bacterium]HPE12112.1 FAD-dependent oxidoreductase [Actinomycetota bacterium]